MAHPDKFRLHGGLSKKGFELMKKWIAYLISALAFVAALSFNAQAQTVDPTQPGLRIKGSQKTETGVDLSEAVCRVTYFAMDGLAQSLRAEVSCWKDRATYDTWAARGADSLPIRKFEFSASNGEYAALLATNATLFSNFIDKIEKVLLQDAKLSEKLRNNRTP